MEDPTPETSISAPGTTTKKAKKPPKPKVGVQHGCFDDDIIKRRDEICDRMREAATDLEVALHALNTAIEMNWPAVEAAQEKYNDAIADANAWQDDVGEEIQEFIDDHGEKWREGERGEKYEDWRRDFSDELEELSFERPECPELDLPEDPCEEFLQRRETINEE